MTEFKFLDTNILIYTDDHDNPEKQSIAIGLFEKVRLSGTGVISTQVLQEYFVAATRKLKVPLDIAYEKVRLFARLRLIRIELPIILDAIELHHLHQFSFWDTLIIQSAISSGCSTLFSEDLQHRQNINSLEIINPFLGTEDR